MIAGTSNARTMVASMATASGTPTPSCLTKKMWEEERGGGDEAAGALEAEGDGVAGGAAVVVGLLDAAEQEDAVVGGHGEGEDEKQYKVRLLEAAYRREVEQTAEVAVLEDEYE
jgi:hypothetical protein